MVILAIFRENSYVFRPTLVANGGSKQYFSIFPVYLIIFAMLHEEIDLTCVFLDFIRFFKKWSACRPLGNWV